MSPLYGYSYVSPTLAYPAYRPQFISADYDCDPFNLYCGRSTVTGQRDCVCTGEYW